MMSMFLYSAAFVITLLMFTKIKVFMSSKFFISWWAYTFPLAAISTSSILMYRIYHNSFNYIVSLILTCITTLVVALVLYRTIIAIIKKELFLKRKTKLKKRIRFKKRVMIKKRAILKRGIRLKKRVIFKKKD